MDKLLLHHQTEDAAQNFLAHPTHALMLVGPRGSGRRTLAYHLAAELLGSSTDKVAEHVRVRNVLPEKDKASISIDAVRELQHFAKLKMAETRIVIIPDAQMMTGEAQNALLKLLEEPPLNTVFLLTVANEQQLLPTVRSRVQKLEILKPSKTSSAQYFATQGFNSTAIHQAYMMSGGLTGLMHALLANADHPLQASVQTARSLLRATHFERLAKIDELAKQRAETQQVLFILRQMSTAAIDQVTDNQTVKRWRNVLQASYDAEGALLQNASAKLVLTNFMLVL